MRKSTSQSVIECLLRQGDRLFSRERLPNFKRKVSLLLAFFALLAGISLSFIILMPQVKTSSAMRLAFGKEVNRLGGLNSQSVILGTEFHLCCLR